MSESLDAGGVLVSVGMTSLEAGLLVAREACSLVVLFPIIPVPKITAIIPTATPMPIPTPTFN
jgi:hypothetical protein